MKFLVITALMLTCATAAQAETSKFAVELELGAAWQSDNDVQIPNDATATRCSLVKDLAGTRPLAGAGRLYLTWNINERHGLRVPWPAPAHASPRPESSRARRSNSPGQSYAAGTCRRTPPTSSTPGA